MKDFLEIHSREGTLLVFEIAFNKDVHSLRVEVENVLIIDIVRFNKNHYGFIMFSYLEKCFFHRSFISTKKELTRTIQDIVLNVEEKYF